MFAVPKAKKGQDTKTKKDRSKKRKEKATKRRKKKSTKRRKTRRRRRRMTSRKKLTVILTTDLQRKPFLRRTWSDWNFKFMCDFAYVLNVQLLLLAMADPVI